MTLRRREFLQLAAAATALPSLARTARAQAYPIRAVTIVVPFPPGGPTDVIARNIAEQMRATLGQPVIIDNVSGANGTIAVGRVARAAADGYTLSIGHVGTHVCNGATYRLQYDLLKDFEPISLLTTQPLVIVAKKSMPPDDLKGLVAWLKHNPDKASAGTAGVGSMGHISGVYFQKTTGTRFQFVPYRGNAPAMQDVVGGQMDLMIADLITALPQVRAGTIKAYAVTARERWPSAPDIVTVDEAGVPGLYVSFWHGLWAPKGTPTDIVGKLNAAVADALSDTDTRTRLGDLGQEIFPPQQRTPEALGAYHKAEAEKWWPIIRDAGIRAE